MNYNYARLHGECLNDQQLGSIVHFTSLRHSMLLSILCAMALCSATHDPMRSHRGTSLLFDVVRSPLIPNSKSGLELDPTKLAWMTPVDALLWVLEARTKNVSTVSLDHAQESFRGYASVGLFHLLEKCATSLIKTILIQKGPYVNKNDEEVKEHFQAESQPASRAQTTVMSSKNSAVLSDVLVFDNLWWYLMHGEREKRHAKLVEGKFRFRKDRIMAIVALPVPVPMEKNSDLFAYKSMNLAREAAARKATHGVYVAIERQGNCGFQDQPLIWETLGGKSLHAGVDSNTCPGRDPHESFHGTNNCQHNLSPFVRDAFFLTNDFVVNSNGPMLQGISLDMRQLAFKGSASASQWWGRSTAGKVWVNPEQIEYTFTRNRRVTLDSLQHVEVRESTLVMPGGLSFLVEGEVDTIFDTQ